MSVETRAKQNGNTGVVTGADLPPSSKESLKWLETVTIWLKRIYADICASLARNWQEIAATFVTFAALVFLFRTNPYHPPAAGAGDSFPFSTFISVSVTLFIAHIGLNILFKERGNASFNPYSFGEMNIRRLRFLLYWPILFLAAQIYLCTYWPLPTNFENIRHETVIGLFLLLMWSCSIYHIRYGAFFTERRLANHLYKFMRRRLRLPCRLWLNRWFKTGCRQDCPLFDDSKIDDAHKELHFFFKRFPTAMCNENVNKSFSDAIRGMAIYILQTLERLSLECKSIGQFPCAETCCNMEGRSPCCLQALLLAYNLGFSAIPHLVREQDIARFDTINVQVGIFNYLHDARPLREHFSEKAGLSFFLLRRACMAGILAAGMLFDLSSRDKIWWHYVGQMRYMIIRLFFRFDDMSHYVWGKGKDKRWQEETNNHNLAGNIRQIIRQQLLTKRGNPNLPPNTEHAVNDLGLESQWELSVSMFCLTALGQLYAKFNQSWPEGLSEIPGIPRLERNRVYDPASDVIRVAFDDMALFSQAVKPTDGTILTSTDNCVARIYAMLLTSGNFLKAREFIGMSGENGNPWLIKKLQMIHDGSCPETGNNSSPIARTNPFVQFMISLVNKNHMVEQLEDTI